MPNPLDSFAPVGGDRLVNSTIANFQSRPSVTFLANGRYVVVFQTLDDEGYNDVCGRVFKADGTPAGPDFPINTTAVSEQDLPRVAALADGGFVVVWEDLSSGTSFDIKARVYEADGSAGGEVTIAGSPGGETSPAVAALPGGGFVVTWSDDGDPDGDIRAQICQADASPAGSAFTVNETVAGSQYNANVTVLADGTIVAVWQDSGTGHILMRLFAPTGGAITSERVVDDSMAGAPSLPCIVALAGGGFAVAWVDGIGDGDGSGIRARLFDAGADPVGGDFVVNTLTAGEQQLPALAALPDGGFVVSWSDGHGASSSDDIRAQRFDASGDRVDTEFVVNAHMDGFQTGPALAADPVSGTIVVAWTDISAPGVGGDDDGAVVQRLFTPGGAAPPANRPPTARDDMLPATEDLPATYDPGALLANDSDPDGDILRVSAVYGAVNGAVVLNVDGTITFTSDANFNGVAGFDYELDDGNGGTATAHATIEVGGAPDPAIIGGTDTGEVAEDGMLSAAGALTISDVDSGESAFRPLAGAAGSYGLFDLMSDGGWNYTLDNNNAFVQALNWGETLSDTITIMSLDGTAHDLTIAISGANENNPPMLDHPIPDQHGTEDIAVSYQVPADAFSDPESDALAYSAALANGDPLPSWLSFDPDTRTFSGMPPLNFNGTVALRVTASDGSTSASDTFDLVIDPVNDAPSVTGLDGDVVTHVEGHGAVFLDLGNNLAVSDPDSANFAGGTVSVRISANKVASEDRIMLGTGATGFTSSGGNLLYNNVVVGTVSAAMGSPGIDALFTFNANATAAIVQQLLRSIGYDNGNHYDPSTARRTIEYVITDGDGGSTTLHSYVDEAALNDAPITTPGGTASGGEDSAIALTGISIRDDGPAGEQVTVRLGVAHGTLDIRLDVVGGIAVAAGQGSNALTLTGTLAQINATLAAAGGLTYRGAANFTGGDTLTITAADNTPADPLVLGTAVTIAASSGPNSLVGGSLTSNPSMDLVYIAGGQVKVRYSNNDGTFSIEFGYAAGSNPTEAILVDYDGDGDRDIVSVAYATGGASTGTIGVLRKTGSFTFDPYQVIGSLQSPYDLSSADLNGDGRADLVVARRDQGMVSVYLSTGAGTYATRADYNATVGNLSTSSLALGDLDGDGRADLIVTNAGDRTTGDPPGSVAVLLNNGAGVFLAPTDITTGQAVPSDVATGDFNGDGKLDIVFTTTGTAKGLTVMLGRGDGSFQAGIFHETGTSPGGVRIADLNGDGIVDLITATRGTPGHLSVFLGAGNGSFAARTDFPVGNDGEAVAVGDLDLDGDMDIVAANSSSNSLSIFLNQTNGLGATVTRAISVTAVNDAPVVTTSAGTTSYVESVNAPPGAIFVDTGLTIADPDDTSFVSATVSITGGFQPDQDVLFFDGISATGNIEGVYNSGTGVLTLTSAGGSATLAQWQAAMRFVFYSNSSEEPNQATRTISFALNDGDATSAAATHMLSVTARNDSPSGASATLAIAEDAITVLTLAHFGFSDVDGDAFSGVHIAAPPIGGALYFDADGAGGSPPGKLLNYPTFLPAAYFADGKISFVPTANVNGAGAASFAFSVVDDGSAGLGQNMDPGPNLLSFDIAPLDDGPALAATALDPTFTEEGPAVDLFDAVTASTIEAGQTFTAMTLTVGNVVNGASEILGMDGSDVALTAGNVVTTAINSLLVTVSLSGTTATLSFAGASLSAAQIETLIDTLSYRDTGQAPGLSNRNITITQLVDSGSNAAPEANTSAPGLVSSVSILAQNDAPTASFASGLSAIEQTPLSLKGQIALDDVDAGSRNMFVTLLVSGGRLTVDVGGTGVAIDGNNASFMTFTGTLAQLQALFGSAPGSSIDYTPTSNMPWPTAPVTLRVYDLGASGSDGANVTEISSSIALVPVNDAPSGADKAVTIYEDQPRTFSAADFGFADVDGHAFAGVVFTTVPAGGTILHDPDGEGGVDPVAVAAGGFVSAADIAAGRLTFVPALNTSGAPLTSFTFQVRDTGGTTNEGADTDPSANGFTVNVTALNDAPTATGLQGDVATFTEGGGPVLIDAGADAVLADVDSANFTLGKLIVAIGGGGVAGEDVLGIRTDAVVTVSGIQIHVNGVFVATMSGGSGGANLVITLNSSEDTPANVQEVLRHITYSNSNADNPTPGQRQLTVTLSDGDGTANGGQDTLTATTAVDVVAVNDAPQGADVTRTTSEDDPYVFTLADFAITDPEGDALQGVYLTAPPTYGAICVDGTIVQTAGASIGAALIQAGRVTFVPDADQFGSPYASFTFQLIDDDGGTDPTPNNFNFNVTPDNLAPAVDLDGGGASGDYAGSYSEGGAAAAIGSAVLVSDANEGEGDLIESATVTLTNAEAGDILTYDTLPAGVSAALATPAGQVVLTFTGAASAAVYAALLADVRYSTTSDTPSVLARVITVTVHDGAAGSSAATARIAVTPTDDAPVAYDHAYIINEAAMISGNVFTDTGAGGDADPDGPAPTVASVNGSSANVGQQILLDSGALLTVNADGTFTYHTNHSFDRTPTGDSGASNAAPADSFTYTLAGGNGATVTLTIQGLDTDDTLRGTAGSDTLSGGAGDDLYHVENAGDRVIELGLYGNDRVVAGASWALTANSEVETVEAAAGTAAINVTGNSLAQTLIGNAGANVLHGGGGADLLRGLGGDDTYYADLAAVQVQEGAGGGTDRLFTSVSYALVAGSEVEVLSTNSHAATNAINLTGNSFNQTLIGNAGANILHGGGGTDLLIGLGGRDIYYIDVASTQLIEYEGGGNDVLYVSTSYILVNGEVETLSTNNYGATTAINLTGNLYSQTVIGNAGNNILHGGGGTDLLIGLGGNDTYYVDVAGTQIVEYEGGGNDTVYVSTSYTLGGSAEVETLSTNNYGSTAALNLIGNLYNQTIIGNAGPNVLHGGGGVDSLIGLGGNDTYYVDVVGTQAYEAAGAGADTVYASLSYALAAGSEVETLSSNNYGATTAIDLTGNGVAQTLVGNAGANALDGGAGADTLLGLGGADTFRFSTALGGGNVDSIGDFSVPDDTIALDDAVFTAIGGPGALSANAFATGAAAADADDRIIYNSATGQLFYDADGSGGGAAVQFATLSTGFALTASDFQVI